MTLGLQTKKDSRKKTIISERNAKECLWERHTVHVFTYRIVSVISHVSIALCAVAIKNTTDIRHSSIRVIIICSL